MPDEIYDNRFVGVRPAWHRKGETIAAGTSPEEAMRVARLNDWDVTALPIGEVVVRIPAKNGIAPTFVTVDGKDLHMLVRKHDEAGGFEYQVVGETLVTRDYTTISNEHVFLRMVAFMAGIDLAVDCGGVLGRLGNRAFMTFEAPPLELPGNESYRQWMVAIANHSGREAVLLTPSAHRVVCANTERMAIDAAERTGTMVRVAHSQAALDRFFDDDSDSHRRVLGLMASYRRSLEESMTAMQDHAFTDSQWRLFRYEYKKTLEDPKSDRGATVRRRSLFRLDEAWELEKSRADALGQDVSMWTAAQAVSTYHQHTSYGSDRQHTERSIAIAEGRRPRQMRVMDDVLNDVGGIKYPILAG